MLNLKNSIGWKGIIDFMVLDEKKIKDAGLSHDDQSFFYALEQGKLPIKRVIHTENKVTNYARQYLVNTLVNAGQTPILVIAPSQMELGTGTGIPNAADTDLWSPSVPTLKHCSAIQAYLNFFAQYYCSWQTNDPIQGTWTEIGLKDANGNLWAHSAITSNLTIAAGEMVVAQWTVQLIGN